MKGGLVSMVYGALAAREFGLLGDGRVVLQFVCDEETGSVAGSGHLREAGLIDPEALAMLTAEPTGGVVGMRAVGRSPCGSACAGGRRTWGRRIWGSTPSST